MLHAPTSGVCTPLMSPVKKVGDAPKSPSSTRSDSGICQASSRARLEPLRRTTDSLYAGWSWYEPKAFPVVAMTSPSGSAPTVPHTLAPSRPGAGIRLPDLGPRRLVEADDPRRYEGQVAPRGDPDIDLPLATVVTTR